MRHDMSWITYGGPQWQAFMSGALNDADWLRIVLVIRSKTGLPQKNSAKKCRLCDCNRRTPLVGPQHMSKRIKRSESSAVIAEAIMSCSIWLLYKPVRWTENHKRSGTKLKTELITRNNKQKIYWASQTHYVLGARGQSELKTGSMSNETNALLIN